ncbi:MAG: CHAP domain-containing protein [Sphingorhabdus sp.]
MRLIILTFLLFASPAAALYEGLQCVPYARALTGVEIRGDAHTWWGQAKGRYHRGSRPKVGAIMAFRPHGGMRLGHIAAVRQIVDSRTVIVSHANWSTIGGRRGHVEENIRVIDASENNDWSRVRVWYTPNQAMGGTRWPLNGFIYPKARRGDGQAKKALVALLGSKARLTSIPRGSSEIRAASRVSAKKSAATFRLSSKALADIDRKAVSEAKTAKAAKDMDTIGDLIGSLGN